MANFTLFYSAFSEVISNYPRKPKICLLRLKSALSIWKNRLCAMEVKDGMNKLGKRVPMYLGKAMNMVTLLHSCPKCIVCLVPEP